MPDHETTLRGLGDYRASLINDLDAVTGELRDEAVRAVRGGMMKIRVCDLAQISRPTLDDWINRQESVMRTQTSRLQQISEATAFDQGDLFESDDQVRDYFTVESLRSMGFDEIPEQDTLDRMADDVIANHWHYAAT